MFPRNKKIGGILEKPPRCTILGCSHRQVRTCECTRSQIGLCKIIIFLYVSVTARCKNLPKLWGFEPFIEPLGDSMTLTPSYPVQAPGDGRLYRHESPVCGEGPLAGKPGPPQRATVDSAKKWMRKYETRDLEILRLVSTRKYGD